MVGNQTARWNGEGREEWNLYSPGFPSSLCPPPYLAPMRPLVAQDPGRRGKAGAGWSQVLGPAAAADHPLGVYSLYLAIRDLFPEEGGGGVWSRAVPWRPAGSSSLASGCSTRHTAAAPWTRLGARSPPFPSSLCLATERHSKLSLYPGSRLCLVPGASQ